MHAVLRARARGVPTFGITDGSTTPIAMHCDAPPARADQQPVVHRVLRGADGADQRDHAGVHAPATQARARHPAPHRRGLSIRRALVSGTAARRRRRGSRTAARERQRRRRRQRPQAERVRKASGDLHVTNRPRHRRVSLVVIASLALADAALAQGTRLLRRPAVSRELVAFEYGGDLWTVPRSGGQARRLTSTPSAEIDPWFSPDGSRLAFTATVGGNTDVYVVPVAGGEPTRLTFHPSLDAARGWSPGRTPRAVRVDARNRAGPGPPLDLQALVGGRRRHRRGQRGSGSVADATRVHRELIHRTAAASPTKRSALGSRPTGRRTRAACGGTIAAGARVRSG